MRRTASSSSRMDGALCFARPIIPCRKPAQFDFTTYLVGADALIGPYKFYRTFPTSIRRKSRARLWSIEGVRGNHPKGFPGLFSFARRFLFGEAKRKCRPFPLSWKKQTKKRMWTPNRLGISKNSARWRKNTEKARKIPNHFKNIPCFFRQRVV